MNFNGPKDTMTRYHTGNRAEVSQPFNC